jgi:hypothetical protein
MDINVERAKDAGVEIATIFNTMQGIMVVCTTDFNKFGKQYRNDSGNQTVPTLNLLTTSMMNNSTQKWRSVSSSISKESMVLKLFLVSTC